MKAAPALRGFGQRWGRRLSRTLVEPRLPLLALEVRPRAVAAVRMTDDDGRLSLAAAASVALPDGAVEVSLTKPNVLDAEGFRATLRAALERVGALSGGPVSLVLPDPATRVALVSGDGVRGRGRDAEQMVRFRLHKALPFEVAAARFAFCPLRDGQILVAVSPDEVVASYEDALESLGFQPGMVEPSSLALSACLAAGGTDGDRLLVNWDEGYVSFVLLRGGDPLLVRTLPGEDAPETVARQIVGTLQFHRDRLGGQPIGEIVVRSAAVAGDLAVDVVERASGTTPRLIEPWRALGIAENGSGAQAVAGAAACVLRRAA